MLDYDRNSSLQLTVTRDTKLMNVKQPADYERKEWCKIQNVWVYNCFHATGGIAATCLVVKLVTCD